jgi:hypothetical protein
MTKSKVIKNKVVKNKVDSSKKLTSFKSYEQNKILSMVFNKLEFKDLVNLNTINKQWNQLINPICKESLRITRPMYIVNGYHPSEIPKSKRLELEVKECISTNEKYSNLIAKFKWNTHIPANLTIEIFTKFSNLTHLFILKLALSQDIILAAIEPLKKLEVLSFTDVNIKEIVKKRIFTRRITLPPKLKKMEFQFVRLAGNTELFTDSINSHTNIEEVMHNPGSDIILIDALKRPYPTLKSLKTTAGYGEYENNDLIKIIESNPQLEKLEIHSESINQALLNSISNNLTGLEELLIRDINENCDIQGYNFNFNFPKLKKLTIYIKSLNLKSFEKLLINSTKIKELHIALSETNWKGQLSLISNLCSNITHLALHVPLVIDSDEFFEELQLAGRKFKDTLKSLSLSNISLFKLDPAHLSIFPELTIINIRHYVNWGGYVKLKDIRAHFKNFNEYNFHTLRSHFNEYYLTKAGNSLSHHNWIYDFYY